jgi:uncharacterized protein YaaN involved in tellurite resistance
MTSGFVFPTTTKTATANPSVPTFSFPTPTENLPVPAAPVGEVTQGLAGLAEAPAEQREALPYYQTLPADKLAQAHADANEVLPQMLVDSTALINYGLGAMAKLNAVVDDCLTKVEPTRIPEAQAAMKDLTMSMRAARGKYDVTDPKAREWVQKAIAMSDKPRKLFHKAGDFWAAFQSDVQDIITQIDRVGKELNGKAIKLAYNAEFCNQLYKANEEEVQNLIYVIGVMELALELAKEQALVIPKPDPSNPGDPNAGKRSKYANLITQLEVKIGEFKSRLFVAWASGPMLDAMQAQNVNMAMKLHTLTQTALPTSKNIILQWRIMLQGLEAAKEGAAIQEFTRQNVEQFAKAAAVGMPEIMRSIQAQTATPEMVNIVVDSLTQMVDGIQQAVEEGRHNREVMDQSMRTAQVQLSNVKGKVDDAIINGVIGTAQQAAIYVKSERVG